MAINYITLRAYNPDLIKDVVTNFLTVDEASASATIEVESITGIADNDYLLLGEFGQETAEIVQVKGSPTGTTVTLEASTAKNHNRGDSVYVIDRNQVEFSRATTLTGSKTDPITGSTTVPQAIQPDQIWSIYVDTANTTGFGFYRFKNEEDSTYSNYSESIPYAGYTEQSLKEIFDSVLLDLGYTDEHGEPVWTDRISRTAGFKAVKDCQEDLAKSRQRWSYLTNFDVTVSELSTGEDAYDLPSDIAYENRRSMVNGVRIGNNEKLIYIDKETFNENREGVSKTTLGSAISATTDVTITLTDSSDFDDAGGLQIVVDDQDVIDDVAYTSNARGTNIVSGVTGIAETVSSGANVWQGASFGEPKYFTIYEDKIYLDVPPDTDWEDYNLLMDYYARPTVVNDLADEAQFPASIIKPYVAYKLTLLKNDGDIVKASNWLTVYEKMKEDLIANENRGQIFKFTPNRKPKTTTNLKWSRTTDDE